MQEKRRQRTIKGRTKKNGHKVDINIIMVNLNSNILIITLNIEKQ